MCCGAEAERKAIADAREVVEIWNARQAGGQELWFYPTIGGRHCSPVALVVVPLSGVPAVRIGRTLGRLLAARYRADPTNGTYGG
jgi:hypothetical protein